MGNFSRWAVSISVCLLLASCTPIEDKRGHALEDTDFSQIIPGQSGEDDVRALLGSPSSISDFGNTTWYYISEHRETTGVYPTEIADQNVAAVHFDAEGHVTTIDHYGLKDGKPVTFVEKETPSEGHSLTFMEQMMGNFGRFSAPGTSIDPKTLRN